MAKTTMTPLALIALFISLTETVLGVGVTQLQGLPQMMLLTFVMVFPVIISVVFFVFLWCRPHTLYTPSEYGSPELVAAFERAMSGADRITRKADEIEELVTKIRSVEDELSKKAKDLEEMIEESSKKSRMYAHFIAG